MSQNLTVSNLIISDSAELSFGNASWSATLTVEGNITLLGAGRLVIDQGWAYVLGAFNGERSVSLSGTSQLLVDDAFLDTNGESWDGTLEGEANLSVVDGAVGGHALLQLAGNSSFFADDASLDADVQPSDNASVTEVDSSGSTLWFAFGLGDSGRYSFPSPQVETNWSFTPTPGSPIGYHVRLIGTWPGLFAVSLNVGSNVTLANSSDLIVAVLPVNGNASVTGLRLGVTPSLSLDIAGIPVTLVNVSVESWSFYPVGGSLEISDSQLGEVQGWVNASIRLVDSNLTDNGGNYAAFDAAQLTIEHCSIGSDVWAYDSSSLEIGNSTLGSGWAVTAVGNATATVTNLSLGYDSQLVALEQGSIAVQEPVSVNATVLGSPAAGAELTVHPVSGPTSLRETWTSAGGVAQLFPETSWVRAVGTTSLGPFVLTAASGRFGAEAELPVQGPITWSVGLAPLVISATPANGSQGVSSNASVVLSFLYPMNSGETSAGIGITPAVPYSAVWEDGNTTLEIIPQGGWPGGDQVAVRLAAGASTALGLALPQPFTVQFSVEVGGEPSSPPPSPGGSSGASPVWFYGLAGAGLAAAASLGYLVGRRRAPPYVRAASPGAPNR